MAPVHGRRFWCCGQFGSVDGFEGKNAAKSAPYTQEIFVRATGSDSGKTPSPADSRAPSDAASSTAGDDVEDATVWFDCEEDFEQRMHDDVPATETSEQQDVLAVALAALPVELATIVKKYKQGCSMGCKPTVAVIKYMESAGINLEQLREQLAAVLAAEQPADDIPIPTTSMTPEERTQSLIDAPRTDCNTHAASQPAQQRIPSVARLLDNVALVNDTLFGMAREEGFKQVAWGKLELWYMHDHVHHRQIIKARTVLDEPVVNTTCLAREVDLVTSWNHAVSDARELATYSPSEVLMYMLCWTPWPLPGPEIVNYGIGIDLLDTQAGCVLVATKGQTELPAGVVVPETQRSIRIVMDAGGFKFVPLPSDPARPGCPRMEATVLLSMDAKRFALPDSIISFMLKVLAPLVYKSVVSVLSKLFHPDAQKGSKGGAGGHSALLDRLRSRPMYAGIDEHAKRWAHQKYQEE